MEKPLSKKEILCCYYARGICNKGKNCPYSHNLSCKAIFNDKKLSALEIFKIASSKADMNKAISPANGNENISSLKPLIESILVMLNKIAETGVIGTFIKHAFDDMKTQCWYGFMKHDGPVLPVLDHLIDRILKDMPYSFRKVAAKSGVQNKSREDWAWDNMYAYAECNSTKPELDAFVLELRQRLVDLKKGIDKIYSYPDDGMLNRSEFELMRENFPALFEKQSPSKDLSKTDDMTIPLKLVKPAETKIDDTKVENQKAEELKKVKAMEDQPSSEKEVVFKVTKLKMDEIPALSAVTKPTKPLIDPIPSLPKTTKHSVEELVELLNEEVEPPMRLKKKKEKTNESDKKKKKKDKVKKNKSKKSKSVDEDSTSESVETVKKTEKFAKPKKYESSDEGEASERSRYSSSEYILKPNEELVEREVYPTYMDKYGRVWAHKPTGPYLVGICP
jgi:hypothetical protein